VRFLLDECVPVDYRHDLAGAGTVMSARYAGLDHLSNGKLLDAMAGRFDVLLTVDTSLGFQQVIAGRPLAVLVVRVRSNAMVHLQPRTADVLAALKIISTGTVVEI
jgi:predicted nuclease of predicted toxin-antitoxin system